LLRGTNDFCLAPLAHRRPCGRNSVILKYPPIIELRPPDGAPNLLIILIDDVGFGTSSAFGRPCRTPTAERLGAGGLKLNRFHTTALCSPSRQAQLTGRNHHSVGMGAITEMATSAPGNNSIRPKEKAPIRADP
jgi:arylsulfatase A-like enzyme